MGKINLASILLLLGEVSLEDDLRSVWLGSQEASSGLSQSGSITLARNLEEISLDGGGSGGPFVEAGKIK